MYYNPEKFHCLAPIFPEILEGGGLCFSLIRSRVGNLGRTEKLFGKII